MRVALLIHALSRTAAGVFEVAAAHAQHLAAMGVEVGVFGYQREGQPEATFLFGSSVTVFGARPLGPWKLAFNPALLRQLLLFQPDVIHTHGIWTGISILSLQAHTRLGVPLIISPHGMLDPWGLRRSSLQKTFAKVAYEKRHLQSATRFHALCEPEAEAIRAQGLHQPVFVLPNGVDLPGPGVAAPPWKHDGGESFLFLGRVHEKKGIFQLVEAWRRIHSQLPGWSLRIAGWGEAKDEARLRTALAGLPRIEFLGAQTAQGRDACYQNAQAFVLPSFSEGMPMTVLEAWAHGVPVLMTKDCNLSEAFAGGEALEIEPSVEALAGALLRFAKLPQAERRELGERGKALCQRQFRWSSVAERLHEHYRDIVQSQGALMDRKRPDGAPLAGEASASE